MTWLFDHTEVITLIAIGLITVSLLGIIFFYGVKDTPEVSDLQGFPETLGDFPPLPTLIETELNLWKN